MPKTLISPRFLKGLGILEGAVEGSKGTWIRLGAALGPLGGMSEAILTHLEVSWAILEAILAEAHPLGQNIPAEGAVESSKGTGIHLGVVLGPLGSLSEPT